MQRDGGERQPKTKQRCTIYDVARYAHVSPSTVSHVLNGTASISAATQARIQDAVRALGYRPNANARALRQPHTHILGVIFPDIASEYYAVCTAGIIQQAQSKNYVVLANDLHFDNSVLESSIPALVERRVDGLIFVGGTDDEAYLKMAASAGVPVILGDRLVEGYPCVEFNNYDTMRNLVCALHDAGYRRFGYVGEALNRQQNLERRFSGFLAGVQERGIPREDTLVLLDESMNYTAKMTAAHKCFRGYLSHADRARMPQVVLTSNDMIAMGVMGAALRFGLRVPEDIAIVGFDNIALSAFSMPSITSVAQDPYQLGSSCFALMMEKMQGGACENIMLRQQIAVRDSAHIPAECLARYGLTPADLSEEEAVPLHMDWGRECGERQIKNRGSAFRGKALPRS